MNKRTFGDSIFDNIEYMIYNVVIIIICTFLASWFERNNFQIASIFSFMVILLRAYDIYKFIELDLKYNKED